MVMNLKNISWNSQPGDREVLISYFLWPSTGGQGSKQRHFGLTRGQSGQSSPGQAIMYGQYSFSEQKQGEAKVKVKETGTTGTQFFPIIIPQCHCPSHNLVGGKKGQ